MQSADKAKQNRHEKVIVMAAAAAAAVIVLQPEQALAGAGGVEFDTVWQTLKDWTQGTLGRIIAGAMILVGIIGGIARQSLMAFALGIGGGMGLSYSPTVVESIMSATITTASAAPENFGNTAGLVAAISGLVL